MSGDDIPDQNPPAAAGGEQQPQQQETLEAVQARHRKEQRDLQSRITQKKKNATKKTRRGVNDECATLERDLAERQRREVAVLMGEREEQGAGEEGQEEEEEEEGGADGDGGDVNGVADKLGRTGLSSSAAAAANPVSTKPPPTAQQQTQTQNEESAGGTGGGGKKRNRQKERLARRAAEAEAAAVAAETEAAGMTDHRAIEKTYLTSQFKAQGLVEHEIQPDGHCLFSAVADQLQTRGYSLEPLPNTTTTTTTTTTTKATSGGDGAGEPGYKVVRRHATDYMSSHRDDFEPFLDMGERRDFGGFEGYILKMRDTAEWGGQLELTALANVYGVEIKVVQDGRTETIEPSTTTTTTTTIRDHGKENDDDDDDDDMKKKKRTIWLAYYRHGYGLGEHYNSLRKAGA